MYVSHGPSNDMPYSIAVVSGTAATLTVIPAVATQVIRVYALFVVASAASTVTFTDSVAVQSGGMALAANAPFTLSNAGTPCFISAPGASFQIINSAGTLAGTVYYTQNKFQG